MDIGYALIVMARGHMRCSRARGTEWQILARRMGVPADWLRLMTAPV